MAGPKHYNLQFTERRDSFKPLGPLIRKGIRTCRHIRDVSRMEILPSPCNFAPGAAQIEPRRNPDQRKGWADDNQHHHRPLQVFSCKFSWTAVGELRWVCGPPRGRFRGSRPALRSCTLSAKPLQRFGNFA